MPTSNFARFQNGDREILEKSGKEYFNYIEMENGNILVVDDNPSILKLFSRLLAQEPFNVCTAGTIEEAKLLLARQQFDVVFTDLFLPDGNGMDLVNLITKSYPELSVVVMTGQATIELAVEAMKAGAFDFLVKPFEHLDLVSLIAKRAVTQKKVINENIDLKKALSSKYRMDRLVGKSEPMQKIFRLILQLRDNEATVLIHGESGTGKELLAQAIHYNSPRKENKFVPVDCGSLPVTLIESELFGHVKGAYTDAHRDVKGLFREADRGTIFLDEIGDLPLPVQSKLLRVLQEREVRPLGSGQAIPVDVRVIAASKRDLREMVEKGEFREDLFYRLNVVFIAIPPLRERMEDITLLVEHFLEEHAVKTGKQFKLAAETMQLFLKYNWPGNVRELQNKVDQALALVSHSEIRPEDLTIFAELKSAEKMPEQVPLSFEAYERLAVERALSMCNNDMAQAAKMLKVGTSTLYRKMKNLGLETSRNNKAKDHNEKS